MRIMVDDVYEKLKSAPDDVVLEVHDFVDFVISRRAREKSAQQKDFTFESFAGVLNDSPSFRGAKENAR